MNDLMKDIPLQEKPRERAKEVGLYSLSDQELIAILLRTGTHSKSALGLSMTILKELNGLSGLTNARYNNLIAINGIGEVKAITLLACVELSKRLMKEGKSTKIKIHTAKDVYDYYHYLFAHEVQELFIVLYLNIHNEVIEHKILFKGSSTQSIIDIRSIYREALLVSAVKIICMHNHPSGDITPSKEDIMATEKIKASGALLSIQLLDHIIIGTSSYYSFLESHPINI